MSSSVQGTVIAITNSQQLWICTHSSCTGFVAHQQSSMDRAGAKEPYPSLLNYLLWIDSGQGETFVFSCISTDDAARLQIVPI